MVDKGVADVLKRYGLLDVPNEHQYSPAAAWGLKPYPDKVMLYPPAADPTLGDRL